jgi:uncharacterized protein YceH (UPF0502 family)
MLTAVEARVIGALLEKERTVPDQYPLSMQALLSACNQSTAREPVMSLTVDDVEPAITSLKGQGYARIVHPTHGRGVTKYRQVFDEKMELDLPAAAVLTVLLLRGPQTAAELRSRAERLYPFETQQQVDDALTDLAERGHVRLLERLPGQSAQRWQQLVADEPEFVAPQRAITSSPSGERIAALESTVADLTERLAKLEAALADLLE